MWIFMSDSFLSVVADKSNPDNLVVRARRPGDIKKVFPNAEEFSLPGRDYQFRAILSREAVLEGLNNYVMNLSYGNFKNSVRDDSYHSACSRVWSTMANLQPRPPYSTGRLR